MDSVRVEIKWFSKRQWPWHNASMAFAITSNGRQSYSTLAWLICLHLIIFASYTVACSNVAVIVVSSISCPALKSLPRNTSNAVTLLFGVRAYLLFIISRCSLYDIKWNLLCLWASPYKMVDVVVFVTWHPLEYSHNFVNAAIHIHKMYNPSHGQ